MYSSRNFLAWIVLILVLHSGLTYAAPSDDLLVSLQPTADVNDFAGILSPAERESLEQRCRQLRERSGAQLAVVVLRSLNGGQVDDFTVKLFERWKVGQAGKNNGVMLLVALDDRKARIEVGYGLEPVLPDALAGRILREQLFPAFRQQQYGAGLSATVNRIAEIVERNEPAAESQDRAPIPAVVLFMLLSIPFAFLPSLLLGICLRRKNFVAAGILLLFPGADMLIARLAGMPWPALVAITVMTIVGAVLGYRLKQRPNLNPRPWSWGQGWPPTTTNTWSWPTSGGSWSGGGFSGGGGGSWGGFGGGSSGGGGASGSW